MYPTQLTVGLIEVKDKQVALAALKPKDRAAFMADHPIPAVLGPGARLYMTDHHHLVRAACEVGLETGFCQTDDDLSSLDESGFWEKMNDNGWVHPLDEHGVRHVYSMLPAHIQDLADDVYRSLAGYVRNAGGYDKSPLAFAEFVWADFFRRNIAIESVKADFHGAVLAGVTLAKGSRAKALPGFKK